MAEPLLENCKFGKTPPTVCLTPGCTNKRWTSDTTGYCRDCKIKNGIPVAGAKRPATVTHLSPEQLAIAGLEEEFIDNMLAMLSKDQLIDSMCQLFQATNGARLTKEQKMFLLKRAVTRNGPPPSQG
jgi:hypothetical protein